MSKKLIYLVSFVLVLGLVSYTRAGSNLVAHYEFEGVGDFNNSVAGEAAGEPHGDAQVIWDDEIGSYVLSLDGDGDYVNCRDGWIGLANTAITVVAWIKTDSLPAWDTIVGLGYAWRLYGGQNNNLRFQCSNTAPSGSMATGSVAVNDGRWHHVAGTYDGAKYSLYVDGILDDSMDASGSINSGSSYVGCIGAHYKKSDERDPRRFFDGLIDDVRIYDKALSGDEIRRISGIAPKASEPSPADGALTEDTWATLSWSPGETAVSHDVYFGENFDDVNAGTGGTFQGNQAETEFPVGFPGVAYPDGLVPGTTYYWRIDEVNDLDPDSPWKGDVWSFTTACAMGGGPLPQPSIPNGFGVNIHFMGEPHDLDLIADGGFKFIRMDLFWEAVERQKGVYEFAGPGYDALTKACSERGIRILYILDYSNGLYESDRSVRTEQGRRAFAAFAEAAAKRYAGKGILWEIWNEPNLRHFWSPQPSVDDYCKLVEGTAPRLKETDRTGLVVAPAAAQIPLGWLEECFKKGLLEWIDALTVHPYRSSPPETVIQDYEKLRELIARYAPEGKNVPIISGEWGYVGGTQFFLSEEQQAQYLVRMFLVNLYQGIPVSIWYDWKNDGTNPNEREHNFGTMTYHLEPKRAFLAAKTLNSTLDGYCIEERLDLASEKDFVLKLRKDKNEALAFWTEDQEHEVTLPIESGKGLLVNFLGGETTLSWETDGLRVDISQSPQYLLIYLLLMGHNPSPAHGATGVTQTPTLRWTAGDRALLHDVYFGENFDDVNAGTGGTFQGNQAETEFPVGFPGVAYPDGLVPGTTYYWRIDEVNDLDPDSPWKGDVWSFTVANSLSEALDTALSFTTGGSADWFGQTTMSYYDGDAAQSGDISHSREMSLEVYKS